MQFFANGHLTALAAITDLEASAMTQQSSAVQESPDALSARYVLPPAARVIMVHVDELPLAKRLVAHAADVLLCLQKLVKQLPGQPVARNPVCPVGLLAGRVLPMRVVAVV
jgi:hypothetical protein